MPKHRINAKKRSVRLPLRLPPSYRTITLTDSPNESPRRLALQYSVCIPCRENISRCDGHEYFTKACLQCRNRGTKCIWALPNSTKSQSQGRDKEEISSDHGVQDDIHALDASTSAASKSDTQDREIGSSKRSSARNSSRVASEQEESKPRQALRSLKFRFPQSDLEKKGFVNSRPVPSAGWETVGRAATTTTHKVDVKGKGKARADDILPDQADQSTAGTQTQVSSSEDEGAGEGDGQAPLSETGEQEASHHYQAILSQINNTVLGLEYIETSNYTALLRSIFAEESSDLSRSLWWWEFSDTAKAIRAKWDNLPITDKKKWRKLSFLDKLLAENTYSWSLWPRPPRAQIAQAGPGGTIYPPASIDDKRFISSLPEAITSTALSILSRSSLPDEIIKGMTPMHIRAWTQNKRDYGFPATFKTRKQWQSTVFNRSKYAIPPSSTEAFTARYLDRDELILDIMEGIGPQTAAVVQHGVDAVLLKLASLRGRKGMRKPPRDSKGDTDKPVKKKNTVKNASEKVGSEAVEGEGGVLGNSISKNKGKGRALEQDERSNTEAPSTRNPSIDPDIEEESAANYDIADITREPQAEDKKKSKRKGHQPPANWEKILLAAIMVPELPRR